MESVQPPAGSQVSSGQPAAPGVPPPAPAPAPPQVPAQRPPSEQLPPAPATPTPERPRRRVRTVLTVVAGVLALLCLGGGIAGYVWYDRATTPDRSTPDVTVISYLQAELVSRDRNRAILYTCDGGVPRLEEFGDQLALREQELNVGFTINLENVTVSTTGSTTATVLVGIRRSAIVDGIQQSVSDTWRFDVEDRDGWRVCSAAPAL